MLDPAIRELAAVCRNFGTICVHLPNGSIASHVMWVDADEDHVIVNTEVHRVKYRAIEANPDVTVTVWSADDPYKYAEIRGRVVEKITGSTAREHIDALAQRYTGADYTNQIDSERVIVKIAPARQRTFNL